MNREIAPGIHWIMEAGPDRRDGFALEDRAPSWYEQGLAAHIAQCAYLLVGSEATLLFDTLSPASTQHILDALDELLDTRSLDFLVVSHPDVPHAGNAHAILREYPEAKLVAPAYGNDHELYRLERATHVAEGDEIDLGGRVAAFHEATFLDAPISIWMTEETTNTLFPVDWMGFPHLEDEHLCFVDELERSFDIGRLVEFHGRVLFWYQYVDVPKTNAEIDRLIHTFSPDYIAPAHGLVIRESATDYMAMMKDVTRTIDQQGRIGTLG